jgi:hypothetical protein
MVKTLVSTLTTMLLLMSPLLPMTTAMTPDDNLDNNGLAGAAGGRLRGGLLPLLARLPTPQRLRRRRHTGPLVTGGSGSFHPRWAICGRMAGIRSLVGNLA